MRASTASTASTAMPGMHETGAVPTRVLRNEATGQRSFAVFGPATWNSLPPSLRAPELSLSTFTRLLKTQLFQHAWTIVRRRCDWTVSSAPHTNIRTQLNTAFNACGRAREWVQSFGCPFQELAFVCVPTFPGGKTSESVHCTAIT